MAAFTIYTEGGYWKWNLAIGGDPIARWADHYQTKEDALAVVATIKDSAHELAKAMAEFVICQEDGHWKWHLAISNFKIARSVIRYQTRQDAEAGVAKIMASAHEIANAKVTVFD